MNRSRLSPQPIELLPLSKEEEGGNPESPTPAAEDKERQLLEMLTGLGSALVAYSGGVDSTYLLWAARRALGERVMAVIGRSDSLARSEFEGAKAEAERLGVELRVVRTAELSDPGFRDNPPDRCYHCKSELYGQLAPLARELGLAAVLDGTNADDLGDYRPGRRAAVEREIRSPLADVGLSKREIRALAKRAGLPFWDKPAMPCLASRFPYGSRISRDKLRQVEEAEALLHAEGFRECRVRHHGDGARIEVPIAHLGRLATEPLRERLMTGIKRLGFRTVTVDPEGLRSGKLNDDLLPETRGLEDSR